MVADVTQPSGDCVHLTVHPSVFEVNARGFDSSGSDAGAFTAPAIAQNPLLLPLLKPAVTVPTMADVSVKMLAPWVALLSEYLIRMAHKPQIPGNCQPGLQAKT